MKLVTSPCGMIKLHQNYIVGAKCNQFVEKSNVILISLQAPLNPSLRKPFANH